MDPGSLDRLQDIVVTPPPGWPPAPGWLVVLGVVALAGLWLVAYAGLRWRAGAYRRAALAELAGASEVAELAALLKRTALTAYGRQPVAALSGAAWVAFLDRTAPSVAFGAGLGRRLPELTYDARAAAALSAAELEELRRAVAGWIRRHEVSAC